MVELCKTSTALVHDRVISVLIFKVKLSLSRLGQLELAWPIIDSVNNYFSASINSRQKKDDE